MGTIIAILALVLFYYLLKWWLKNKKKKKLHASLEAMLELNLVVNTLDGVAGEEEQSQICESFKNFIIEITAKDIDKGLEYFGEYFTVNEEGSKDLDFNKMQEVSASIIEKTSRYDYDPSGTDIDNRVYTIFDSLTNLIIENHRDLTFKSLVSLCGADLDLHPNEIKALDYLAKKLRIKNKDRIVGEERERIEQVKRNIEANKEKIALWDEKIKNVNVPGWKDETAVFMGYLYDKEIHTVLSTSDEEMAKNVPGVTEAKANVIKKQLAE